MKNLDEARAYIASLDFSELIKTIISNPIGTQKYSKISIVPHVGFFQATCSFDNKVSHINYTSEDELKHAIAGFLGNYKQIQIMLTDEDITILSSKSGKITIKTKKTKGQRTVEKTEHNRQKNYIISEDVPWLYHLGVATKEGKIKSSSHNKFRQINKYLEIIQSLLDDIPEGAYIVDAACGKAYLTFAVHHYLNVINNKNANIIGIDLKADVMENCQKIANDMGLSGLNFMFQDLANFIPPKPPNMLISLHACDIATDYAIASGINWNCKIILATPCCHHEAATQIKNADLLPILKHGILKEKMAAALTDGLRALKLEAAGYSVTVQEFIDPEHTPKNILIRGIKTKKPAEDKQRVYGDISKHFGLDLTLDKL